MKAILPLLFALGCAGDVARPPTLPDKLPVETFVGKLWSSKNEYGSVEVPQKPGSERASLNWTLCIPAGFEELGKDLHKLDGKWVEVKGVPCARRTDGGDRCLVVSSVAEVKP